MQSASALGEEGSGGFMRELGRLIGEANQNQIAAEGRAEKLVRGEGDVVDAVLALNKADISLRMVMQMRDRLIQAYQEVLRTV